MSAHMRICMYERNVSIFSLHGFVHMYPYPLWFKPPRLASAARLYFNVSPHITDHREAVEFSYNRVITTLFVVRWSSTKMVAFTSSWNWYSVKAAFSPWLWASPPLVASPALSCSCWKTMVFLRLPHPYGSGWGYFGDFYGGIGQATYGDWGGSVNLLRGWGG